MMKRPWLFNSRSFLLSLGLVTLGILVLAAAITLTETSPSLGNLFGARNLVYEYQGGTDKLTRMQTFHDYGIFEYETVGVLTLENLDDSIKENARMPRGTLFQKYTYVIPEFGDSILVAYWKGGESPDPVFPEVNSPHCHRDDHWTIEAESTEFTGIMERNIMINIYPEAPGTGAKFDDISPCWVMLSQGNWPGFLDVSSKHLMLAQGEGKSISDFKSELWTQKKVRGAGELVIDLTNKDLCTYVVNNHSGTYRPKDVASLRSSAQKLTDLLEWAPTSIMNEDTSISFESTWTHRRSCPK